MIMDKLLFLCHRIPYPPNKGDKIRSFHFLEYLARHYRVYLGTFIDDPDDERWVEKVREYCADLHATTINPTWRKIWSLRGMFTGEALGLPYYRDARLRGWVERVLRDQHPGRALVFSSTMAQYLIPTGHAHSRLVVDFVDVDSEKWRAYAVTKPWPISWIYRREASRLRAYEQRVARDADASVFVSAPEAELFNSLLDVPLSRVSHVENGVDVEYFRPDDSFANPYTAKSIMVFTGAMDYWANADAVAWFAEEILPEIRVNRPEAEFWIVGARPTPRVKALGEYPGVCVTGAVPDIRPYLQHANLVVAPLRIARGIQNKVLEAMAMNKPVVGTTAAFEGISTANNPTLRVADDAPAYARRCIECLRDANTTPTADSGRAYVVRAHDWTANLHKLHQLLAA